MTDHTLHPTPSIRDVLCEQIRVVVMALRPAAIAAAAMMGVATALIAIDFIGGRGGIEFAPELSMIPAVVGGLLPIGVWRGERRFGPSFLWTLPVDRRQMALTKVLAGWTCLMATVTIFVIWLLLLTLVTDGNVLAEQTLLVLPSAGIPIPGTLSPSALTSVRWFPTPVLWLVPFTAATGTYLLASALAIGSRYPLRWILGTIVSLFFLSVLGAATHSDWLKLAPARLISAIHESPYGLDALFTARMESLKTSIRLSTGVSVEVWRALPDLGRWATASALWIGGALMALSAAASRHRESRRSEER